MYERILASMGHQTGKNEGSLEGLVCDACDMGPCSLCGYDDDYLAPCGINKEQLVLKNLGEKVVEGMAEYGVYKHNLTKILDLDRIIKYASRIIPISIDYTEKIYDIFENYRFPRIGSFGLGGLEAEYVNICAIGPPELIYDLTIVSHDTKYSGLCSKVGAKGINIVSLGAPGAEVVFQMGTPCIGNSISLEDANATGAMDFLHFGKDPDNSILSAISNYKKRRDGDPSIPEKEYHRTGLEVDTCAINQAYRDGDIAGAVVLFGARSLTCEWDMPDLVKKLLGKDYVIFVNGAHLYKGTELGQNGPSVIHLGFCEPAKTTRMDLDFKPTILFPGWKNPKLLTCSLAMAHEGYETIMGNDIFGSTKLVENLGDRNCTIMKKGKEVLKSL